MGRKKKHTCAEVAAALKKHGGVISKAIEDLDVTVRTIYRYIDECQDCKEVIEQRKEKIVDMAEGVMLTLMKEKQDRGAAAFFLKTLGRRRGYVERQEVTGADGGPIRISIDDVARKFEQAVLAAESDDASKGDAGDGGGDEDGAVAD